MTENNLMTRVEAAKYLGLTVHTLAAWATETPLRLPMIKMGSRVMYKKSDLDSFVESSRIGG